MFVLPQLAHLTLTGLDAETMTMMVFQTNMTNFQTIHLWYDVDDDAGTIQMPALLSTPLINGSKWLFGFGL